MLNISFYNVVYPAHVVCSFIALAFTYLASDLSGPAKAGLSRG
jgi:hypothetical protein